MYQPRYGGAGAVGRRMQSGIEDRFAVEKRLRDYDSEDRRQRRLGMAQAGLLGLGGALAFRGGRGIRNTTKLARTVQGLTGPSGSAKQLEQLRSLMRSRGVVASPSDLGYLGGGAAGIGGAGLVRQHAENPRNRRYL